MMNIADGNSGRLGVVIEAELHSAAASVQLMDVVIGGSRSALLSKSDDYRIDLAMTPRIPTQLCLTERWSAHRRETAGRLFIIPPGHPTLVTSGEGRNSSMVYMLSAGAVASWVGEELKWSDRQLEAGLNVTNPTIASLLAQVASEARHPGFASDTLMQSYAMQIAVNVFRHFGGIDNQRLPSGLSTWCLKKIDERLNDFERTPSLAELADLCKLSVRHLSRAFRASRGISIGEYIGIHRLEIAKEMLSRGERVKTIAFRTGFASTASFCCAFRKMTGMSPGEFRRPRSRAFS